MELVTREFLELAASLGVSPNRLDNVITKLMFLTGKSELVVFRGLKTILERLKDCKAYTFDDLEYFSDEELLEISGAYYFSIIKCLQKRVEL